MFPEYPVTKLVSELKEDALLPAILFRTSRKQCDNDIVRLGRYRGSQLSNREQEEIKQKIEALIKAYGMDRNVVTNHAQYGVLVTTGAGAHHAGQLLMWRLLLEELMTHGLLRLMIATGTVAAGVDFPARTVIITAHSKRGSEGFRTLSSSEFQQMSGRAGRRGKDAVGLCLVAPGPFSDARVIHEVAKRPSEPLRSAYFAAPSSVLNLLKYRSVDDLRYTVERSLASFLDRKAAKRLLEQSKALEAELEVNSSLTNDTKKKGLKRARRWARDAEELQLKQVIQLKETLAGLERLGYMESGKLTEKGAWAAHLCTNLVLELGECVSDFLFDDLTTDEIVGLVASIAGDPHRSYLSIKQNPIKAELFKKLQSYVERVQQLSGLNLNSELVVVPEAAVTVLAWMESTSWEEFAGLLRLGGVAEGDAARVVMQTAEHLGQMCRLYETHPTLATAAAEGRRRLLKPPISESMVD